MKKNWYEYEKFGVSSKWQLCLAKWWQRSTRLLGFLDSCRLPLSLLARTRYAQIVPLGYNCETAFRFYCTWGFLDSSLFAWTSVSSIDRLVKAIADLDRVGTGDMRFSNRTMMWTCANTDICFHGRLKPVPIARPPSQADLDADLADLRGRIAHLKEKLRRYAANDRSTLFVYKPRPSDIERDGFNNKINALEQAIDGLGAQNWKLLVVCERSFCDHVQPGKNRIIRTVRRYSPPDDVTARKKGDPAGWKLIFTEFAPEKILPKKHAFKFE